MFVVVLMTAGADDHFIWMVIRYVDGEVSSSAYAYIHAYIVEPYAEHQQNTPRRQRPHVRCVILFCVVFIRITVTIISPMSYDVGGYVDDV